MLHRSLSMNDIAAQGLSQRGVPDGRSLQRLDPANLGCAGGKEDLLHQSMNGVDMQFTMHQCSENGVVSVYLNPGMATATKVIHLEEVKPEYGERLSQEATVLRRLHHVNIVAYHSHTLSSRGVLRLVMEYVPGHDLFDFLLQHGPPNIATLCHIVRQILGALKYLHAQHIAHGDMKLENVMLTDWSHVKLIDFGYAVMCDADMADFGNVMPLMGMGTLGYSAPEIHMGEVCFYNPLSADVYSVTVSMGVLLCGQFDETSLGYYNPNDALDFAPGWLSTLMLRGLTHMPSERPSMAAMLSEFTHQSGKHSI
jgi:serine/threonine protein kinase